PMLMVGATDGREFRRIGFQSYGFLPMNLPPDIEIFRLIHAADERIPDECLRFGASCIFDVLTRFDQLA
ncbi:MAG: peptidase M20, partial [Chloroflexota bacterium]|nr:peptidase M20 [Chloroflexota bacterium]